MKKLVVLTGAGISAESGIRTFRDSNGLWENHRVEDIASPEGWKRDPKLVLDFYNQRRRDVLRASPNTAHLALVQLEKVFAVHIITQNVDDLHERAGSKQVLHLHGEILKVRSTVNEDDIHEWKNDLHWGDTCPRGSQLRPHIVWFGESVPLIYRAQQLVQQADVLLVIGTSLQVYPAAGLLYFCRADCQQYLIDPNAEIPSDLRHFQGIKKPATIGVPQVVQQLIQTAA